VKNKEEEKERNTQKIKCFFAYSIPSIKIPKDI